MIRTFEPRDEPALLRLIVELQEFERGIDPRLPPGGAMAQAYFGHVMLQCERHAGVVLVADSDGDAVGFVVVMMRVPFDEPDDPEGEYAYISDLVVAESHRGLGVGSALMQAAEQRAVAAGARELRVSVLFGNEGSRALYSRMGFAPYLQVMTKALSSGERR